MSDKSRIPDQMNSEEEFVSSFDPLDMGLEDPLQALLGNTFAQSLLPDQEGTTCSQYTVRGGDTLWGISQELFGSGERYPEIFEDNREVIGEDPDLILPGQQLQVCQDATPIEETLEDFPQELRDLTPTEQAALNKLQLLAAQSMTEGKGGEEFAESLNLLSADLQEQLLSVDDPEKLPDNLKITMAALELWVNDPGDQWGEGFWDSEDLDMSAPEYATISETQYKCNAFVAEAVYQATGQVHQAIPSQQEPGKYFPYRPGSWTDSAVDIEGFDVTTDPQMGDVWSDGGHMGIYLGEYNGQKIYISARDTNSGAYGTDEVQYTHGIQVKTLGEGGTYQTYNPEEDMTQ